MLRKFFVAASAFALLAINACSSDGGGSASGEDELRGRMCGGIAGLQCPAGQRCKLEGNYPDAAGTCESIPPGQEGGMCGGIAGFVCESGLHCDYSGSGVGLPPGAVGIPARPDTGSGMPPGAVGLPAPARDAGSGMPPGAVGLPAPARDAGSGMPPGAVGLPNPYPDQSGTCVRDNPNSSFCARARCAAGTTCDEEQHACIPNQPSFCARARCASGTECNEAQRACVPYVCPASGTINCMPTTSPTGRNKACSGNYHTWVVANCPGVMFAY